MKIGILQTGHAPDEVREDMGDYDEMFEKLLAGHGLSFETYPVVDGVFPDSVEDCDGWLITGSKHGAYEDHDWIPPLEEFIRDARDAHRPLVGICFGHQIVAQALGGKVEKVARGWSVGRTGYEIEGTPLMLNAWHQDQVTELPREAEVIGHNDFCPYAALRYGDDIWTVQPHPEFTGDYVAQLVALRGRGLVPDAQLDRALDETGNPTDNDKIADRIADFLKRGK